MDETFIREDIHYLLNEVYFNDEKVASTLRMLQKRWNLV